MSRPRIHANPAARVAAYRATRKRLQVDVTDQIASTVASLADQFDTSQQHVMRSLVRFALSNRDWRKLGLLPDNGRISDRERLVQAFSAVDTDHGQVSFAYYEAGS